MATVRAFSSSCLAQLLSRISIPTPHEASQSWIHSVHTNMLFDMIPWILMLFAYFLCLFSPCCLSILNLSPNADPQDALLKLCAHIKNLSSMGQESLSWPNATPRIHRNLRHDFQKLPSIQSRPNTILNTKCLSPDHLTLLTGGRFVAKTDTNFLEVVVEDFDACVSQYTIVDKEQQGNDGYVATFLASLDLFHSWSWTEVLEFSYQVNSIHVDKGLSHFSQGSRVEGIHIILRGEAQMEFDSTIDRPERDVNHESSRGAAVGGGAGHLAAQVPYGFSVDKTVNEDGQPVTRVTKKHQTKSIGLTVCFSLCHPHSLTSCVCVCVCVCVYVCVCVCVFTQVFIYISEILTLLVWVSGAADLRGSVGVWRSARIASPTHTHTHRS